MAAVVGGIDQKGSKAICSSRRLGFWVSKVMILEISATKLQEAGLWRLYKHSTSATGWSPWRQSLWPLDPLSSQRQNQWLGISQKQLYLEAFREKLKYCWLTTPNSIPAGRSLMLQHQVRHPTGSRNDWEPVAGRWWAYTDSVGLISQLLPPVVAMILVPFYPVPLRGDTN